MLGQVLILLGRIALAVESTGLRMMTSDVGLYLVIVLNKEMCCLKIAKFNTDNLRFNLFVQP